MDQLLSDDYQAIYDSSLAFFRDRLAHRTEQIDRDDAFPHDVWREMGEQGYLGAGIDEQYGGSGGDFLTAGLICQSLTRVCPALALSYGAHLNLCAHSLQRNGTEEQKQQYLPGLCSGEVIGALALTEPDFGSDAMGIRTTATRDDALSGYRISGSKMFITNGPIAGLAIVYAKTDPEAGNRGITAFIVELPADGFSVGRSLDKVGMRGSPTGELAFDQTPVSDENILGSLNQGFKVVMSGLDVERAFLSFLGVGVMEECLELSLTYARERKQFGVPIASFQLVQAKLADMYASLYADRLATQHAVRSAESGSRVSRDAAAALLRTAEDACKVAEDAVQIHGGYGLVHEYAVQRLWRDAKLATIGAGTSEIRRLLIARELLGER